MKIIVTTEQMRRLLALPDIKPKYPILVKMKNVSKDDLAELTRLLKGKT